MSVNKCKQWVDRFAKSPFWLLANRVPHKVLDGGSSPASQSPAHTSPGRVSSSQLKWTPYCENVACPFQAVRRRQFVMLPDQGVVEFKTRHGGGESNWVTGL